MKLVIFCVVLVLAVVGQNVPAKGADREAKCSSCLELFELLKELGGKCSDHYTFARNVEFACQILRGSDDSAAIKEVCNFTRRNSQLIFNYVYRVDKGINPPKDCWLFMRCDKPQPPTSTPFPSTTHVPTATSVSSTAVPTTTAASSTTTHPTTTSSTVPTTTTEGEPPNTEGPEDLMKMAEIQI